MISSSAVSALLLHHHRRVAERHALNDDFAGALYRTCRVWPARKENAAWLEAVLTAIDRMATKLICFADRPKLARAETATFRYRILQVAALDSPNLGRATGSSAMLRRNGPRYCHRLSLPSAKRSPDCRVTAPTGQRKAGHPTRQSGHHYVGDWTTQTNKVI